MKKKIFGHVENIVIILLVVLLFFSTYENIQTKGKSLKVPSMGSYMWLSALSGSMKPVFNTGDLVVEKKVDSKTLKKGDIITFRWEVSFLTTHRITDVYSDKNGKIYYKTKGDFNKTEDKEVVSSGQVVGKYLFRIPFVGYLLSKLKGILGIIMIWLLFLYVVGKEIYMQLRKKKNNEIKIE